MNRITQLFADRRRQKRKVLIGFLTAGDPDLRASEQNIHTALKAGLDMIEIGVPFSDPTADGPTIQAAGQRALKAGTTLKRIFTMAQRMRRAFPAKPMILFSYANPLFRYGYARVGADAAAAGFDGLLVVDLPFEESGELRTHLKRHGLLYIQLIAPTTSPERAKIMLRQAEGFVYYILVKGVTGARTALTPEAQTHLAQLRTCTALPIAAGFGISSGRQARAIAQHADAVIVGSALVEAARAGRLATLVRDLAAAVRA